MPERQVTILAKLTDNMSGPMRKIVGLFKKVGAAALKAGTMARGAFRGIVRGIGTLQRSILNLRNLIVVALGVAVVKVFADFEKGITTVATLVDTTVVSMEELKDAVLDVSVATGESLGTLNEALFDIISAGVEAKTAGLVLLEASKLAKGGATSTAAATKGMVSIMNAYGLAVSDAAAVSDAFFQAQKAGITTVDQLARNIGKLAPTAQLAGLSIDEMLAAVAAVTKQGVSTTQAVTGLKSVVTALIKPTEGAKEAARKLEIQWDTSRLKAGNFAEFLAEVAEKTQLDEVALAKLFPNVRAFATFASLAANDGQDFVDVLESMEDKTGATNEAFVKMGDTLTEIINKGLAQIRRFFVNAGEAAKPFIVDVVNRITKFVEGLNQRKAQVQAFIMTVARAIGQIGRIIGSIFGEGDVIRLVINVITGAVEAGVRTIIAAIPVLVRIAQRVGREIAVAFVDALVGSSQEALARKLASGKRGAFRAGLRLFGFDEHELEELAKKGRALEDQLSELEAARARGAQAPEGSAENERFKRAQRGLDRIRQDLAGEAFDDIRESDRRVLAAQVEQFLGESKEIYSDFFAGLPEGLSPETKDAMARLGEILGPEWNKALQDAVAADEKTKAEAAKAGEDAAKAALTGATGTGISEAGGEAADFNAQLSKLEGRMESLKSSMSEYRTQLARIDELTAGGFITRAEGAKRTQDLQDQYNDSLKETEELILQIQAGFEGNTGRAKLYAEQLQVMSDKLAAAKDEIAGANVESGTLWTGLQAGILNTIETLGDLRQAGLSAGQAIASGLGDGVIAALEKGKEGFKEWGLTFLRQMAAMILKAMIFKAIMAGLGAAGVGFSEGGGIGFAGGGSVPGPRGAGDIVPARLSPGEFVQTRQSVDYYGPQVMEALRRRLIPRGLLASYGRTVRPIPSGRALQGGGMPSSAEPVGPSPAFIVANEQNLERQLAGGQRAFMRFLRANSRDVKAALET